MSFSSSVKAKSKANNDDYSLKDIMNSLKSMHSDIQSIKSKLLTQENTTDAILSKIDNLASDLLSFKK